MRGILVLACRVRTHRRGLGVNKAVAERIDRHRETILERVEYLSEAKTRLQVMEASGRRGPAQGKMNRLRQEIGSLEQLNKENEIVLKELGAIYAEIEAMG